MPWQEGEAQRQTPYRAPDETSRDECPEWGTGAAPERQCDHHADDNAGDECQ
jgi:hypothetical protein